MIDAWKRMRASSVHVCEMAWLTDFQRATYEWACQKVIKGKEEKNKRGTGKESKLEFHWKQKIVLE